MGRPGSGLVFICAMINQSHAKFKLSVEEPEMDSKLASMSFSLWGFSRTSPVFHEVQPLSYLMISGKSTFLGIFLVWSTLLMYQ